VKLFSNIVQNIYSLVRGMLHAYSMPRGQMLMYTLPEIYYCLTLKSRGIGNIMAVRTTRLCITLAKRYIQVVS
jgi:hypothetical protein